MAGTAGELTTTDPARRPTRRGRGARDIWRLLGLGLLLAGAGCLEAPNREPAPAAAPPPPARVTNFGPPRTAQPEAYQEALAQYRARRGATPEVFTVAPRSRPQNEFPGFNDELFVQDQPERLLPPLHDGDPRLPRAGSPDPALDGFGPGGSGAEGPGGRLKPIEQLVYGGDHLELDAPEKYRLQPRDTIRIEVRDHPELGEAAAAVAPDGSLRLSATGDYVAVRGLTVEDATDRVRTALRPYLKEEPEVRLTPRQVRGGYYYVFGDVLHPGRYPLGIEPVRASEAVLAANWEALSLSKEAVRDEMGPAFPAALPRGRFAPPATADLRVVQIHTSHRSQPARTVHDLESALYRGATGDDPYLRSGQLLFVPSRDPSRNPVWSR